MSDGPTPYTISITEEGEMVRHYPNGISVHTGIILSDLERVAAMTWYATTAARTDMRNQHHSETVDPLTGVVKRRAGEELIEQLLHRIAGTPYAGTFSIIMLDLDHFKRINSEHGHPGGDDVLRWFGRLLLAKLRKGDIVMRWGGEEFVIATHRFHVPNEMQLRDRGRDSDLTVTDRDQRAEDMLVRTGQTDVGLDTVLSNGRVVADRILRAMKENPPVVQGTPINVTATLVVSSLAFSEQQDLTGAQERMFAEVAERLKRAKNDGERNRVIVNRLLTS